MTEAARALGVSRSRFYCTAERCQLMLGRDKSEKNERSMAGAVASRLFSGESSWDDPVAMAMGGMLVDAPALLST